jgi:hypothetical protein
VSLTFKVYDETNTTLVGTIANAIDGEFVEEYNEPGYGTVTVILGSADAALLTQDRVVRVEYESAARFAFIVETLDRSLVSEDGQKLLVAGGRGLLAWLEDAVVFPQAGLRETSSDERPFNYAAADGPWKDSVTWSAPLGVRWRDDTSPRAGLPANWPDADAQWIWSTDPDDQTVPEGTVNYFRSTFTLTESTRIRFFATADNFFDMYLDGQLVMSSSKFSENAPSFAQRVGYAVRLGAGEHTIAARVRNGQPWQRYSVKIDASSDEVRATGHGLTNGTIVRFPSISKNGTGLATGTNYFIRDASANAFKVATSEGGAAVDILTDAEVDIRLRADRYAGFLMTAFKFNNDGRIDRTVRPVRRTNVIHWEVATEEPLFRPAMILRDLIEEADDRGVYRLGSLSFGYDTATPTNGSWTEYVDLSVPVGMNLLEVKDIIVDFGIDFWIDPGTTTLNSSEQRGTTKSVTLGVASNLLAYSTTTEPKVKTQALIKNTDGWQETGVSTDTLGRREIFVEAGRTRSRRTARIISQQLLTELARKRVTATTVEAIPVTGAKPFVDFGVGDTISIPEPTGSGTLSARVLSIAMQKDGGGVRFMPELEVL